MVDNRGINPRYLTLVKKGVIVGFCSSSCKSRFGRNPRPYLSKIPGLIPARVKITGTATGVLASICRAE